MTIAIIAGAVVGAIAVVAWFKWMTRDRTKPGGE
jgi:hypothetical protein